MMIGLLLAGQHTSSTTTSWMGFFMAKHPEVQVQYCRPNSITCSHPMAGAEANSKHFGINGCREDVLVARN